MTGEQLLIALGSVDETLLEASETYRAPRRLPWKAIAAAACFALSLSAGAAALHHARIPVPREPDTPQTSVAGGTATTVPQTDASDSYTFDLSGVTQNTSVFEPAIEPPQQTNTTVAQGGAGAGVYAGQDGRSQQTANDAASAQETDALFQKAPICTKYPSMTWQGRTYASRGNSDPNAAVQQTILGETELMGFDGKHKTKAQVLPIGGISQEAAVAVRFPDDSRCYTYVCASFAPATLGAYLDAFDLWENATFTRVSGCSRRYAATIYPAPSAQTLRALFDRGAKRVDVGEYDCPQDMLIDCTVPILGVKGSSFGVSETGYLLCRLTDSTVIYYIGAERAQAFLREMDSGDATRLVATTEPQIADQPTQRAQEDAS